MSLPWPTKAQPVERYVANLTTREVHELGMLCFDQLSDTDVLELAVEGLNQAGLSIEELEKQHA